jgi:hypothetical protein
VNQPDVQDNSGEVLEVLAAAAPAMLRVANDDRS